METVQMEAGRIGDDDRPAGPPPMRASDADRDRTLETVRQAHAEGRLTVPELHERIEQVYLAKTYAELDEVTFDLPSLDAMAADQALVVPAPRSVAPAPASREVGVPDELRDHWRTWGLAVGITTLIWVLGALPFDEVPQFFWPVWVAGPWGLVLLVQTLAWWRARGDDPPAALPPGSGI